MNREAWLTELAAQVKPLFKGLAMSPYRITCGWPSSGGLALKNKVIGECHSNKSSTDGVYELFISPTIDQPLQVGGVVCHEMAHISAGTEAKHGRKFVSVCKHVGLTKGKPTSIMPGDKLNEKLSKMIEKLGAYPHKAMNPYKLKPIKEKTQVRLYCQNKDGCDCSVVISVKLLEECGLPTCRCGSEFGMEKVMEDE